LITWIFPPLALLNIVWNMEGSNGNENTLIWNESCERFLNEVTCENEVMEESQEESKNWKKYEFYFSLELLQISQRKKWSPYNWNALCWSFFVWMTMQKWYLMHFISYVICCVIPILCFLLTQEQN
jgi:hypothetical protein